MQVPAHFEYQRARSVEHAISVLARYGPESRVLAGGHSLIPMMKLRLAAPELLVDINDLGELSGLAVAGSVDEMVDEAELRIGALVRHAELLASRETGEHIPMLHDAERVIADPIVRNRGTVGGSVCQADPSEDLSAAFSALRAVAVIAGTGGRRRVPMREFFIGPYETAVGPAEILVELRVPLWCSTSTSAGAGGGSAYRKVHRRHGDWAVAGAAAALRVDPDNVVTRVGIGLTAVGARHFVAVEAEEFLRGRPVTSDNLAEAGRIAARHCSPAADQRGPADYKRHLAGELTRRALTVAAARAGVSVAGAPAGGR